MTLLKRYQSPIDRLLIVVVAVAILVAPVSAANFRGTITYKTAGMAKPAPLVQATINVYNTADKGAKVVTVSNDQGKFTFSKLAPGAYIVIVEKNGRRLYQGRVEVRDPETLFDIQL